MDDKDLERIYDAKEWIDDKFEAALKRWSDRNGSALGGSTDDFADYIPNLLEELGRAICHRTILWHDPDKQGDLTVYFWPGYIRNKSTQRIASSRPNPFSGPTQVAVSALSCGIGEKSGQPFFLCPSTYWYSILERYKNPNFEDQFIPSGTHKWIVENHRRPGEKERVDRRGQHNISQLEVSALKQSELRVDGDTIKRDRVTVQLDLTSADPLANQLRYRLEVVDSCFTAWPWPKYDQPELDDLCLRLYDIWLAATFTGKEKRDSTNQDVEESVRRAISLLQTPKLQQFPQILGLDDKLQKLLSSWTAGDPLRTSAVIGPNGDYLETHFRFWNTLAITEPTVNSSQMNELGSAMLLSSGPLDPLYLMLLQNWIALYYSAIRSAEAASEERKLGEGQVVSAFAHQIKHLTRILAGNWHRPMSEAFVINECDPEKLKSFGPTKELGTIFTTQKPILNQSSIFPHLPTLKSAGLLMKLWCMSDSKDDIPFNIFNRPLDEIAAECWSAAVDEMSFFAIGRTLSGPMEGTFKKSAADLDRYCKLFKQIFSRIEISCWATGATSPSRNCLEALPFRLRPLSQTSEDPSEYARVSKFVWFCRLMMSLLSDVIKHGDPSKPPQLEIHLDSEDIYRFVLSNYKLHDQGYKSRQGAFAAALKGMDSVSDPDEVEELSKMLETMIIRNMESTKALAPVTGETVRYLCSKELNIPWPRQEQTDSPIFSHSFKVDFGRMQ